MQKQEGGLTSINNFIASKTSCGVGLYYVNLARYRRGFTVPNSIAY